MAAGMAEEDVLAIMLTEATGRKRRRHIGAAVGVDAGVAIVGRFGLPVAAVRVSALIAEGLECGKAGANGDVEKKGCQSGECRV